MGAGRPRDGAQGPWRGAAGPTSACSIAGSVARGMGSLGAWTHVWVERGGPGTHPPALGMGANDAARPAPHSLCSPGPTRDRRLANPRTAARRSLRAARGSWPSQRPRCLLRPPLHPPGMSGAPARRRAATLETARPGAAAAAAAAAARPLAAANPATKALTKEELVRRRGRAGGQWRACSVQAAAPLNSLHPQACSRPSCTQAAYAQQRKAEREREREERAAQLRAAKLATASK